MIIALAVLAGLYLLLIGLALFVQRKVLFPAPPGAERPDVPGGLLVEIPRTNRVPIACVHFAAPPGAPTIVHFHGNGEQLADAAQLGALLRRHGVGFLGVEYPGYGLMASDPPSERAIYDVAEEALEYGVERLGIAREGLVLEGQSLGTGVAVEMARRGYGTRIILISPYTSIPAMAAHLIRFLPMRWLMFDRFDTIDKAPSITLPVLIIHGTDDEIVPFREGETLSRVFPNVRFEPLRGAHHNDVYAVGGRALIESMVGFAMGSGDGRERLN